MRGSRNFRQGGGGPGPSDIKKISLTFFSPQLILQNANGLFQRKLEFFKVPEGSTIFFRGGVQLFLGGGSNCLFPIETHITCVFSGVPAPCPPLDQRMQYLDQLDAVTS